MKVFLSTGNPKLEEIIQEANIEIIDFEDNLFTVYDILDFISMDALIINRLLDDEDGEEIIKIARKAKEKDIKIIILTEELESYSERKVVTNLVNEDVTAFIKFDELTKEKVENTLKSYPKEFDFSTFSKPKIEYREVVQSVFKKVITVYSPTSEGTSTIASHLAHSIAQSRKCKVCLLDFNVLKPKVREIFDMTFDYSLSDLIEAVSRKNLTPVLLESYARESKYIKGLDVISGIYDLNEIYMIRKDEFEEIIEKAKFNYDYVVIDTSSWYDVIPTDRALYLADEVVVPIKGKKWSIDTLNRYLDNFKKYNDFDIRKFKVLINKFSGADLTSIEIESKVNNSVIGYISEFKDYDKQNGFKNKKLLREYISVLNKLGIEASEKRSFIFGFKKAVKNNTRK